jgi:outer membrane protein assembly factor BamB
MHSPRFPSWTAFLVAALLIAALAAGGFAAPTTIEPPSSNWPRWRGPQENGHAADPKLPVKWTDADVAWKTSLPGDGQSTPIIWGDRIFLTSALGGGKERLVFAVDRRDGKLLWRQTAWKGEAAEPIHKMNGWASASCATDGEIVAAFFGRGGGLHVYTVDGKHLWSKELGHFESPWGVAACPILVDDMIVQNCDADLDGYIAAFDKRTGKVIWRTDRLSQFDAKTKAKRDTDDAAATTGGKISNRGWSTPIVTTLGGRRELVLNGHEGVRAYDPATGKELWFCKSFAGRGEPTVTPAGELLCVVNGLSGDFYAVKPGGSGDVTATHMAWHTPRKGGRDTPSPIVVGKFAIVTDMKGIFTCYDVKDGHEYWKERVGGNFSGSPIANNGLVYFLDEDGRTVVIKPAESLQIVAENQLTSADDEIFRASPTPCDGQLFIRSTKVLYCIGKK